MSKKPLSEILTPKQIKAFQYLTDPYTTQLLYGGGAGGGKSFLLCLWLFYMCFNYPGTRYLMGRAVLKTLKETTLATFFDIASMFNWSRLYTYNEIKGLIRFENGSEILLKELIYKPSDKNYDRLGSLEITGAVIDECNQIQQKAKDIVMSRCRYKLNEYNLKPKLAMSCNPAKNWVYQEFYDPNRKGKLTRDKRFVQALVTDNPHIAPEYITNLRAIKDEAIRERLLRGNWDFDDDPRKLIEFAAIKDLYHNDHVLEGDRKRFITADIAMRGSDLLVILVWKGFVVVDYKTVEKSGGKEVLDHINKLRTKWKVPPRNVVYDNDGVGAFLGGKGGFLPSAKSFINNAAALPLKVSTGLDDQSKAYGSLKDQCGYLLADQINEGNIYLKALREKPDLQAIINEDLGQIQSRDPDQEGRKRLKPKKEIREDIGRSPDWSDALLFRMYFELQYSKISSL